eukprot:4920242-Amphidinium_carterae.1
MGGWQLQASMGSACGHSAANRQQALSMLQHAQLFLSLHNQARSIKGQSYLCVVFCTRHDEEYLLESDSNCLQLYTAQ